MNTVERIEAATAAQQRASFMQVAAMPGNPDGFAIREFPSGVAFTSPQWPQAAHFNHFACHSPGLEQQWADVVSHFESLGLEPRFRIPDPFLTPALQALLEKSHLNSTHLEYRFHTAPPPPGRVTLPPGIAIRHVQTSEDLDLFLELMLEGLVGSPRKRDTPSVAPTWEALRTFHQIPDRRLYIATFDGAPVGQASMFFNEGLAYLAMASTLPAFRRRGVHTAMLQWRMHDAAEAGCARVACGADVDSQSQRNQERLGLRIAYRRQEYARTGS